MCYAMIGGVEWLPAYQYLLPSSTTTLSYVDSGLCAPSNAKLYNIEQCTLCRQRRAQVDLYLLAFVVLLEHVLMFIKLCLIFGVPDTPTWVVHGENRRNFRKRRRLHSGEGSRG
uniref:Uncharacterized protein n=1 Tax=Calcidiscus leptoporus TaxID=127549 RepID=A0A7S0JKQ6_9EUKA|mmetsp:Transcript_9476/g.21961  ORF Transcript_9476/g.21961 Transcript_9476/m.21961 type:complete len:114 (+) Transcript_9476:1-342(+)